MKKKTIAALIAALTITSLTACGGPDQLSKSVTVELGDEEGIKVTDILDISKDEAKDAKLDTKDVDFYKEGSYDAKLTYNKKDYTVKVKIKDTTAPEATAKENITVQTGTALYVTDCLSEITEASGNVKAEFVTKPDDESSVSSGEQATANSAATEAATETTASTENADSTEAQPQTIAVGSVTLSENDEITYQTAGDYDNDITVTDDAGNETKISVKISVIDAPVINGVTDKTVTVGDTIDYMAGVTAVDGKGNDITGEVQVDSSAVNTGAAGTYQAAYTVKDSFGLYSNAVSNITVNEPVQEPEQVADTDNGGSTGSSDKNSGSSNSSGKKNKGSKGNSSSGSSSGSSSASSDSQSSGGGSSSSGGGQSSNPKAGVAETLYDGSVSNGITGEEKAHIDGIVQKWLSGGCSGSAAEDEACDYLLSRGYNVGYSNSCKDARILVDNGQNFTLNGVIAGTPYYYYGKMYTTGEMNSDARVAYQTNFSISQ